MAKNLLSFQHVKVSPANINPNLTDQNEILKQTRDYVRQSEGSYPIHDHLKLNDLEVNMKVLDGKATNILQLHIYGVNGEYIKMPYSLITGFREFYFPSSPNEGNFIVNRIGFSCEFDHLIISFTSSELSDEEKPRFLN